MNNLPKKYLQKGYRAGYLDGREDGFRAGVRFAVDKEFEIKMSAVRLQHGNRNPHPLAEALPEVSPATRAGSVSIV